MRDTYDKPDMSLCKYVYVYVNLCISLFATEWFRYMQHYAYYYNCVPIYRITNLNECYSDEEVCA